jgi:hypothetical protein
MTRSELRLLSEAHAVALVAMVAPETRKVPMAACFALREAAEVDFPDFVPVCIRFCNNLRHSHGELSRVAAAGRTLRDKVAEAMVFVPHDIHRADLHG